MEAQKLNTTNKKHVITLIKESGNYYGKRKDIRDEEGRKYSNGNNPPVDLIKSGANYGKDSDGNTFYMFKNKWYTVDSKNRVQRIK